MKVHLFGARSSPSCSGFCLKQAAEDSKGEYDDVVIDRVKSRDAEAVEAEAL